MQTIVEMLKATTNSSQDALVTCGLHNFVCSILYCVAEGRIKYTDIAFVLYSKGGTSSLELLSWLHFVSISIVFTFNQPSVVQVEFLSMPLFFIKICMFPSNDHILLAH